MPEAATDLALIVAAGDYERAHYALAIAATAAALDKRVTVLVTLDALAILRRPGERGVPGWHDLPSTMHADAASADGAHQAQGIATLDELLDSCVALGVRFLACEMALRQRGFAPDALRADLGVEVAGLASLLAGIAPGGQVLAI